VHSSLACARSPHTQPAEAFRPFRVFPSREPIAARDGHGTRRLLKSRLSSSRFFDKKCMGSRTIAIVAVIFAFVSMTSALAQPSVHPIGDFAQLRETGEHVYGFTLRLWRDGEDIVGIWSQADGQPPDFPTVAAENVTLDPASGALRFTIRWRVGSGAPYASSIARNRSLFSLSAGLVAAPSVHRSTWPTVTT
jgi:hypothetical protein